MKRTVVTVRPALAEGEAAYTPALAAEFLGVKPKTLSNWRCSGGGPRFHKMRVSRGKARNLGGRVVYYRADLEELKAAAARLSTSDVA